MKRNSSNFKLIDARVFWSMAVCVLISLVVLSFRIKKHEPCSLTDISVKQGPLYVGEIIQFKALTKSGKADLYWDFGDKNQGHKSGISVNHTFSAPGRYEVFLKKDNHCSAYKTIYIQEAPLVVDEKLKPVFSGPRTVEVGSPAVFEDVTPDAHKWEWRFGETNGIDADKQKVSYIYKTPGPKTVILIVNDKMQDELMVLVTNPSQNEPKIQPKKSAPTPNKAEPLPPQGRPQAETVPIPPEDIERQASNFPDVSIKQLENIILGMAEGKTTPEDLSVYACNGQDLFLILNGRAVSIRKLQLEMKDLGNPSKVRNLKVTIEKDPIKNCIKKMTISFKKKWF